MITATIPILADESSRNCLFFFIPSHTEIWQQLAAPSTNECTEAQKERFAFFHLPYDVVISLKWYEFNSILFN